MKIFLNLLMIALIAFSCNYRKTNNSSPIDLKDKKEKINPITTNTSKTNNNDSVSDIKSNKKLIDLTITASKDSIKNWNHSPVFLKLLKKLKNDGYNINKIPLNKTQFNAYNRGDNFAEVMTKSITIPNINKCYYKLKKKSPTSEGSNMYSRFNLSELYLEDTKKAETLKLSIDSIIDCTSRIDLKNEKTYDYCVQFSNRIIYVSCNSMYLSDFSYQYKPIIEKMTK